MMIATAATASGADDELAGVAAGLSARMRRPISLFAASASPGSMIPRATSRSSSASWSR
jgi:hypothetical protein